MISFNKEINKQFDLVLSHVRKTSQQVDCSGAALLIIHQDKIVTEEYWGRQSKDPNSRLIQADTQFHVASVRKSYIGYAIAYAVNEGYIGSIDDPITRYLPSKKNSILEGTTLGIY